MLLLQMALVCRYIERQDQVSKQTYQVAALQKDLQHTQDQVPKLHCTCSLLYILSFIH